MNVEQRVLTALQCREPDRVPVFLYLNPYVNSDWYSNDPSYSEVLQACKRYADTIHDWEFPPGFFHTAVPLEQETRQLADGVTEYVVHTPAGPLSCQVRVDWRGGVNWREGNMVKRWICEPGDVERLLSLSYVPSRPNLKSVLQAREFTQDKWVVQATFEDPLCVGGMIDATTLALWTIENRGLLRSLFDVALERIVAELQYCLENGVGPIYYINGPELALPPLMSPHDFDEFVVEYDRKLVELVHSYPGNYVIIHSHGRVNKFLEKFASIGIDGLNVLEPPPIGDTVLAEAKKRIGDRVCLIGNIQYDDLARGTEGQIERLVADAIEQGAPGGGFILSPSAFPYERPLPHRAARNMIRYLEVAHEKGCY